MKQLIVLRHGKSDWNADYGTDHDRPLAKRGRAAALSMGHFLSHIGWTPEVILASTAMRASETARLVAEGGGWTHPVEARREIYGGSVESILGLVLDQSEAHHLVLLVGHEPTCSDLASRAIGGGELRFPTAAMVRIDFAVERWADVELGRGVLAWFVTPKLLKKIGFA